MDDFMKIIYLVKATFALLYWNLCLDSHEMRMQKNSNL